MRWAWLLLAGSTVFAADERHLAMLREAQAAFDRVQNAASPDLAGAQVCVQTESGMLAVALPAEEHDLHYRKGYCELAVASITHAEAAFADAAIELDRAEASMMAWIARRAGNIGDQESWARPDRCPASCEPLVPVANLWLGWLALQKGQLDTAVGQFSAAPGSGWASYADGLKVFQAHRYPEAAQKYRETLDTWRRDARLEHPSFALRLSPPADIPAVVTDLGGAQLLAGDPKSAVATLDQAILTANPSARAFFLRARARELAGEKEPALSDYNMASRTAFAAATGLASGEAHLYRGILFYRRKDYARAEEEFSSALNLEIPVGLRADASAWRHLSAVASGSCGASREYLERALLAVSPYFPKDEARAAAAECSSRSPARP